MRCPNPGCGRKVQVADSRERDSGYVVYRIRKCYPCKEKYKTREVFLSNQNGMTEYSLSPDTKETKAVRSMTDLYEQFNQILVLLNSMKKMFESPNRS